MAIPENLSQAELARRLNRAPRQIRNLHEQGIPRLKDGTYPWPRAQEWFIRFKQNEKLARTGNGQDSDYELARARKTDAEATLKEIEIAQLQGSLIPLELHEERVQILCERLAAKCKGLGRYLGDVQRASTDIDAAQLLERISDELLRSLMSTADELDEDDLDEPGTAAAA